MKKNLMFTLAAVGMLVFSGTASAQPTDQLLAYGSTQGEGVGSVDDDILAAMQALDEVEILLEGKNTKTQSETADIADLIAAANVSQAKPEPKHDVQTAPVKAEPKAEAAVAAAPKAEAKPEPKHDVQTAPVKAEPKAEAAVAAAPKAEPKPEPKHDVQIAPVKAEPKAEAAIAAAPKAEPKPEAVVAAAPKAEPKPEAAVAAAPKAEPKAAPKHDVQTAPVKAEPKPKAAIAAAPKAEPKPEAAVAAAPKAEPKAAPKHDVQTAPVKAQAKAVAPDGTRLAANQQGKVVSPNVETAPAPHALSLSYVKAVYMLNGVDLNATGNTIAELYQFAFAKKLVYQGTRPAIGDLVFFHNTVDRNRDGLWNDWHSMIGIVEAIDKDETISVLVFMTDKVERIYLNLKYPELYKGKKGQILNSQLRSNEGAQKGTAAKLFAGFANLLGDASSVTVIDNWKPGMKIK